MSREEARRAIALAFGSLEKVGPVRLRSLLAHDDPLDAWAGVVAGDPPIPRVPRDLADRWRVVAATLDPGELLDRHVRAGVSVVTWHEPAYPEVLRYDRAAPGLLVWRGDLRLAGATAAAVVGTRRCTRYGRDVAFELGAGLAEAGVHVVSGLALGIDGAAHRGALAVDGAAPVGVVGSGLDRPYPRRHEDLWREVGERGLLLTEAPLGVAASAWRFPSRNRLIAALGGVTVVVESALAGGSMHTVREADDRGRTVMAVPGSVRSEASRGTNQLLAEGCPPCRDVEDVLVALGLAAPGAGATGDGATSPADATPDPACRAVLDALHAGPATLDQLALRTALPLDQLARSIEAALEVGAVAHAAGWYERVHAPAGWSR
jgi:DNA processing protein